MTAVSATRNQRATGRVRKGFAYFGIAVLLNPCVEAAVAQDRGSGVWDLHPEQRWRVSESLRIGERDGDGPAAFGYAQCVAVDAMDRIWAVEGRAHEIRVFGADGSFVRTVRQLGEGAGKFQMIGDVFPGPGEEIWAEEWSLRRYQVFDTAGTWIGSHPFVFPETGDGVRAWTRQSLLVVREALDQNVDTVRFYERVDGALRPTQRKAAWPIPEISTQLVTVRAADGGLRVSFQEVVPFAPLPRSFFGSELDGWLATQVGRDHYELRRISLETGDDLLAITHRYKPVEIPNSLRKAAVDSLVELHTSTGNTLVTRFNWRRLPRHYRAFESFHLSAGGEVWVRRTLAGGLVGFDVFAADGQYLGQPAVPAGLGMMALQVITESSIYAIDIDDDGVEYVVRFDVVGGGERRATSGLMTGCGQFRQGETPDP